jgi:hypothetical protein
MFMSINIILPRTTGTTKSVPWTTRTTFLRGGGAKTSLGARLTELKH